MKNAYSLVDPFWGNGATQSRRAEGIVRGWNWLKAQTGNTHPGAQLPLGWVSVCPYSGAYPTGYGRNGCSGNGPAPQVFDRKAAWGVTHFQMSGTGYVGQGQQERAARVGSQRQRGVFAFSGQCVERCHLLVLPRFQRFAQIRTNAERGKIGARQVVVCP